MATTYAQLTGRIIDLEDRLQQLDRCLEVYDAAALEREYHSVPAIEREYQSILAELKALKREREVQLDPGDYGVLGKLVNVPPANRL